MHYQAFIDSLPSARCPDGVEAPLAALWFDANNNWERAHKSVQNHYDSASAHVHAYLHRKEGDDWNARYWYEQADKPFPEGLSLSDEWQQLVQQYSSEQ